MARIPRISEAEWIVMRVLWERSPKTANQVVDDLASLQGWHPRTVKTLLGRLVRKGALGYTTEGRVFHYLPRVAEEDCVRAESRSFIDRVFGGALSPMLAQFIEETPMSPEEIGELKRLLAKKGGAR